MGFWHPRCWAHTYPRGTGQGGAVRLGHVGCPGINPIPQRSVWGPFMGWEGWVAVTIHDWEPELGCSSSHPRFIPCAACLWAENAPVPTSSGSRVAARRFPTPKGAGSRGWGQAGRAASPLTVPCPKGASWRTAAGTCHPPAPGTRCRGRGPCGSRGECGWLRGQGTRLSGDGHGAPKGRLSPPWPRSPRWWVSSRRFMISAKSCGATRLRASRRVGRSARLESSLSRGEPGHGLGSGLGLGFLIPGHNPTPPSPPGTQHRPP